MPPPSIFFPSFSFSSCFSCLLSFFFFFSFMPNWACYRTRLGYLFTFSPFPFFSSPLTYAWLPSNFFSSPFLFLLGPCQASLFSLLSSSFLALIRLLSSLSYFLLVGLGWAQFIFGPINILLVTIVITTQTPNCFPIRQIRNRTNMFVDTPR